MGAAVDDSLMGESLELCKLGGINLLSALNLLVYLSQLGRAAASSTTLWGEPLGVGEYGRSMRSCLLPRTGLRSLSA